MIDASHIRVSELVGIAYVVYLSAIAAIIRLPLRRRLGVWVAASIVISITLAVGAPNAGSILRASRDWAPGLVILLAYFSTGAFFVAPSARIEAWLKGWDDRLIGPTSFQSVPHVVSVYLDLVYDFCFLLIPAGFGALIWAGALASADRFWTIVSVAEYIPFGAMPWLQARPPWAIEGRRAMDRTSMRRFSLSWVNHTTIRANTFPSGHASASLAVALALMAAAPRTAAVFALLAVSIAVASVVGRFHYALDAITGLLLAIVVWFALSMVSF